MYKNLYALRKSLGLTQEKMGEALGLPKTTYFNYENQINEPNANFWIKVSDKFGVSIDYLLGRTSIPQPTVFYQTGAAKNEPHKNNLKALRERLNLSQKEICAIIDTPYTTYNNYETGLREPRAEFWIKLANTFNVSIEYLMGATSIPDRLSGIALPQKEIEMLELFRQIPVNEQDVALGALRGAVSAKHRSG